MGDGTPIEDVYLNLVESEAGLYHGGGVGGAAGADKDPF